jgi:hypothetical protein
LDAKPYDPGGRKQPPAQDRKRMNNDLDVGAAQMIDERAGFRDRDQWIPAAGFQPTRERSQLQVRAIKPGRRVQK